MIGLPGFVINTCMWPFNQLSHIILLKCQSVLVQTPVNQRRSTSPCQLHYLLFKANMLSLRQGFSMKSAARCVDPTSRTCVDTFWFKFLQVHIYESQFVATITKKGVFSSRCVWMPHLSRSALEADDLFWNGCAAAPFKQILTYWQVFTAPILPLFPPLRPSHFPGGVLPVASCSPGCVHHGEPPACRGSQLLGAGVQRAFLRQAAEQQRRQVVGPSLLQDPPSSGTMRRSRWGHAPRGSIRSIN